MKTIILCGGYGTRIRDVADNLPKPMIPVGRYPILWHLMKYYASFDHKDFVLCLGYKGQVIKEFFLNYEAQTRDCTVTLGARKSIEFHTNHEEMDWRVTLAETGTEAMTGARLRKVRHYIGADEHFMLTYGDGLGNVDLDQVLAFHKKHGRILTVTGVRPPGRFGELMNSPEGLVTEFNEKPQATGGRISGGFFVCRREIFDYLDDRENLTFEQEPMRRLVKDAEMMMYPHEGFWQPMDTYRDYTYLNSLVTKGEAPWIRW
ncbi:MAG: glucose-1-phosphate cytidylyltransferase [Nitrospirae bacterium]|nr:glucose-1-phosphate cytidylyltransferase [Candidatus Manganitrophaceae bacterium]